MEAGAIKERLGVIHPKAAASGELGRAKESRVIGWLFGGTALTLVVLMGIGGLLMRLDQAHAINIGANAFYRVMTLHGAGMIVAAVVGTSGGLWFALRDTLHLNFGRMIANWACTATGALLVLISTLVGGFATAWTFLYPLPFMSAGQWDNLAAIGYLVGLALVAIGFFIFCIDVVGAATNRYGGLSRALGWAYLRGRDDNPPPPPAIAAVVIGIQGMITTSMAFPVVFAELTRAIDADTYINALWAKNLTYHYGHTLANLTIYLAAGMLYALLPRYTGRQWKTTKPIVIGWAATLVIVLTVYSHHLYMDFAQPEWAAVISMVGSSAAAIPVAVVTVWTGLMLVWGSQYRWTLTSALIYLGFLGWMIGGAGAVIDSIVPINFRFHNTLWVPAHFHTYMMLGVVFWILALVLHLAERAADTVSSKLASFMAPILLVGGGYTLVGAWFYSGALGIPRRYADHFGGVTWLSVIAAVGAITFAIGISVALIELLRLLSIARKRRAALPAGSEQAAAASEPDDYEDSAWAARPMIATKRQFIALVAALTVSLVAFTPAVDDFAAERVQWHHFQHGGQFLFGLLLAVAVVNTPSFSGLRCRSELVGILGMILGPAVMFVMMIPSFYSTLVANDALHIVYHLAVILVGLATGWALTAFSRFNAWLLFVLMASMGFMYGAGVGIVG